MCENDNLMDWYEDSDVNDVGDAGDARDTGFSWSVILGCCSSGDGMLHLNYPFETVFHNY